MRAAGLGLLALWSCASEPSLSHQIPPRPGRPRLPPCSGFALPWLFAPVIASRPLCRGPPRTSLEEARAGNRAHVLSTAAWAVATASSRLRGAETAAAGPHAPPVAADKGSFRSCFWLSPGSPLIGLTEVMGQPWAPGRGGLLPRSGSGTAGPHGLRVGRGAPKEQEHPVPGGVHGSYKDRSNFRGTFPLPCLEGWSTRPPRLPCVGPAPSPCWPQALRQADLVGVLARIPPDVSLFMSLASEFRLNGDHQCAAPRGGCEGHPARPRRPPQPGPAPWHRPGCL